MKKVLLTAAMLISGQALAGYNTDGNIWTIDGKVPVTTSGFTAAEMVTVNQGIDLFQTLTPVRLVNKTNEGMYYNTVYSSSGPGNINKYIKIVKTANCQEGNLFSPGSFGLVTIGVAEGCMTPGYISGKLGKAVGLRNEHQRADRDQYVKYNDYNVNIPSPGVILANKVGEQFSKLVGWATGNPLIGKVVELIWDNLGKEDPLAPARRQFAIGGGAAAGSYDYCSFTHFGLDNFNNLGQTTLQPLQQPSCYVYNDVGGLEYINFTGQRVGLSQGDVAAINAKYPTIQKNRPIVYLSSSFTRPATNVIRFTVSSVKSHAASGAITVTNWSLNHTPSCQIVSGGSGAPGCLFGTTSYVRDISKTNAEYVFEIVNDRGDNAKVSFTATDSSNRSLTDTIDVRK